MLAIKPVFIVEDKNGVLWLFLYRLLGLINYSEGDI